MTLEELFRQRCQTPHNIEKHMPLLRGYAQVCPHITEFGTETGFSTTAFLMAGPAELHCYDIVLPAAADILRPLAGETRLVFHVCDTLTAPVIEETDLLFIDTLHTYEQVKGELERHGHRARRYLVFHDIVSCPEIVPAIAEYMSVHKEWTMLEWREEQSGLAVFGKQGYPGPGGVTV